MNSKIEVKDEKSFPEPPRFRKAVYLSAIVAAVGGFICGYDTGSISGILAMDLFNARFFNQSNAEYLQGLLLAFFMMTAALGSFTSGALCGKKKKNTCFSSPKEYQENHLIFFFFRSIKSKVQYHSGLHPFLYWCLVSVNWSQFRTTSRWSTSWWFWFRIDGKCHSFISL
jgi:hypothetical protein